MQRKRKEEEEIGGKKKNKIHDSEITVKDKVDALTKRQKEIIGQGISTFDAFISKETPIQVVTIKNIENGSGKTITWEEYMKKYKRQPIEELEEWFIANKGKEIYKLVRQEILRNKFWQNQIPIPETQPQSTQLPNNTNAIKREENKQDMKEILREWRYQQNLAELTKKLSTSTSSLHQLPRKEEKEEEEDDEFMQSSQITVEKDEESEDF